MSLSTLAVLLLVQAEISSWREGIGWVSMGIGKEKNDEKIWDQTYVHPCLNLLELLLSSTVKLY